MKTPRKVFADIREEAEQKADSLERSLNSDIEDALRTKYAKEHPSPEWGNGFHAWDQSRAAYVESEFKPVTISAEDKENIAKNYRTESYLNMARRGIATILITAPLIFSAGSCVSCAADPDYKAFSHKNDELYALHWDIGEAKDFIFSAERDSLQSVPYRATPEEVGVMKKRLEKLTNYRDSVKNSPEYARMEEASSNVQATGWRKYIAGIVGAIGMGFFSGFLGNVTKRRRERKNSKITGRYMPEVQ